MAPESRRSFVKKSMAASISVSSAAFFSSLIRARGDDGGGETTTENTTTEVWETTYAPTTEAPTTEGTGTTTDPWDPQTTTEPPTEETTTEHWDETTVPPTEETTTEDTTIVTTHLVPRVKHIFSGGSDPYPDVPGTPLGSSQGSATYVLNGTKTDTSGHTTFYSATLTITFDPQGKADDDPAEVKSEQFKIACTVTKFDPTSNSWVPVDSNTASGVLKSHTVTGSVHIDDKGELAGSAGTDNPPNESNVYGKTTATVTWIKDGDGGPTLKCAVTVECSNYGISETHNGFAVFEKVMVPDSP